MNVRSDRIVAHLERDASATAALAELEQALRSCAEAGCVVETFDDEVRPALAATIRSWRAAELPEASLAETIVSLGEGLTESLATGEEVTNAQTIVAVLDGVQVLVRRVERTFRSWRERLASGVAMSTAVYADVLGAELRNRLQAATTALELLDSEALEEGERTRLESLLLDAITAAIDAAEDVRHLAGTDEKSHTLELDLGELARRTVTQLESYARARGVSLSLRGPSISTPVDAAPVQVLLYNVITMAVDRAAGLDVGAWVRVATERLPELDAIALVLTSNAELPSPDDYEIEILSVGPQTRVDRDELSLWLTREALTRLGGSMDPIIGTESTPTLRMLWPARTPTGRPARTGVGT